VLAGAGEAGLDGAEVTEPAAADEPEPEEAQAGGPAVGAPGVGAPGASAAAVVAQPGLVAALAGAALAGAALGLANPGLANPAPVSSRARAAAASADVLPSASPPDSGFASLPVLGVLPGPAARSGPFVLPDFATLTGAGGSPGSAGPPALAALSGPGTASALPLAADFFPAAAHTESLGIVTSERGPSAGLATDGGLAASEDDEPFPAPAWTVFACTVFASAGTGLTPAGTAAAAESDVPGGGELGSDWSGPSDELALAGLAGLLPGSALALPDLRRFVSSLGAASPASSASSATGSACLSTRPPVKSLATTLSATSYAWALIARSPQS